MAKRPLLSNITCFGRLILADSWEPVFARLRIARFRRQLSEYLASGLGISAWSTARALRFPIRSAGGLRGGARRRRCRYWAGAVRGTGPARAGFSAGPGIACEGPVRSILLISRLPLTDIRTLAVDSSSRTSVALARILLAERYGCRPRFAAHEASRSSRCWRSAMRR